MIIYNKPISEFINACNCSKIRDEVVNELKNHGINHQNDSEQMSWEKSLPYMAEVLNCDEINKDIDVAIEYKFNESKHRIDFILYGKNDKNSVVMIFELKQWSSIFESTKQNCVFANTHGSIREDKLHPSCQAYFYSKRIGDMNKYVQDNHVDIKSASYLHNLDQGYLTLMSNQINYPFISNSPVFLKGHIQTIRQFVVNYINQEDHGLLYNIDASLMVPSTELRHLLDNSLKGKDFWSYDDQQALSVYTIVDEVKKSKVTGKRKTIIIKGGPGTGKSIVAINALGKLLNDIVKMNACYCTQNATPRNYFGQTLIEGDYKKETIKELFVNPSVFASRSEKYYDCIFADEAHRIAKWKFGLGIGKDVNMLDKLFNSSLVNVFFIDEDQAVTVHDYATIDEITKFAKKYNSELIISNNLVLTSQFRCLGGEEYTQFVKSFLKYDDNVNFYIKNNKYDLRIFDDPNQMRNEISKLNEKYGKCRLVSGYTHNWVSRNDPTEYDFQLANGFKAQWNFNNVSSWIHDESAKDSIGCIHTCQGIDMQYCGVIIGKDLRCDGKKIIFDRDANAKTDASSGIRSKKINVIEADRLIRNTYNVLLTRGMRGTFIYCENQNLSRYLKSIIKYM